MLHTITQFISKCITSHKFKKQTIIKAQHNKFTDYYRLHQSNTMRILNNQYLVSVTTFLCIAMSGTVSSAQTVTSDTIINRLILSPSKQERNNELHSTGLRGRKHSGVNFVTAGIRQDRRRILKDVEISTATDADTTNDEENTTTTNKDTDTDTTTTPKWGFDIDPETGGATTITANGKDVVIPNDPTEWKLWVWIVLVVVGLIILCCLCQCCGR